MKAGYTHLRAENWDEGFRINRHSFAAGFNRLAPGETKLLRMETVVLVIRINNVFLPAERPAQGESDGAAGQIKQVGSVNVQIKHRELAFKKVVRMQGRKP